MLGVAPNASAEEVAAAYRSLAKRWHPDRADGPQAARRMAEINAAYDLLRSERWLVRRGRSDPPALLQLLLVFGGAADGFGDAHRE